MTLYNMKIFDNYYVLSIIILLFIHFALLLITNCPCDETLKNKPFMCIRHEFYGVQFNHLYFFIILGLLFPTKFVIIMFLGIIWEIFEYFLDVYPEIVTKYMRGGCLSYKPPHVYTNEVDNYIVYRGIPKYVNPIDKAFGIKNSTIHGWHGSVAEIVVNVIGFGIGKIIHDVFTKN